MATPLGVLRMLACIAMLAAGSAPAAAQGWGTIHGTVSGPNGRIGGVTVLVRAADVTRTAISNEEGAFIVEQLPAGRYVVVFSLGERTVTRPEVTVGEAAITSVDETLDWDVRLTETVTVFSAGRRLERIVDAPGAITTVPRDAIALEASNGQIPRMLEFTPGVQITQSGLYDANLNVRGFNQALTRRVQVLLDGRDISIPSFSSQEWSFASTIADDLASVELLRGPSAALHGPNTFNGVLTLTTKAPRDSQGSLVRFTAGSLATAKMDGRWAGQVGSDWYMKVVAGYNESRDFARSRDVSVEYPGVGLEGVAIPDRRVRTSTGTVRVDRYLSGERLVTIEGGAADSGGVVFVTPGGRSLISDADRLWARANYHTPSWNLLGFYNRRDAPGGLNLATGGSFDLAEDAYQIDLQGHRTFGRARIVGDVSIGGDRVDSADSGGVQTFFAEPSSATRGAVGTQVDYSIGSRVQGVAAVRWDDSTLHDAQISPKAAFVVALTPNQKIRGGYNRSFQRANYGELFIRFITGALDLSGAEAEFAPLLGGTGLGFSAIPVAILGNENLKVEEIHSAEVGYSAIVAGNALLSVNYYRNEMSDFITDVLPGVNPAYGPYRAPVSLPAPTRQLVEGIMNAALPGLSNDPSTGAPLFVLSLGNAGEVHSQGLETAVSWSPARGWLLDANHSWFDFNPGSQSAGIVPNSPTHTLAAGAMYQRGGLSAAVRVRWVDDFAWASGVHRGLVPSYTNAEVVARVPLSRHWSAGVDVNNVFNDRHYELFGGDLLGRRGLVHLTFAK
jgi:outer membrane receptor protein involved in Fe transport